MKKQLPTSGKATAAAGWHRHLEKDDQRRANRGTRQAHKREDATERDQTLNARRDEVETRQKPQSQSRQIVVADEQWLDPAIEGELIHFFETGAEGVIWMIEDGSRTGYDALELICDGDHLTITDRLGAIVWAGVICCDKKTGWRRYLQDSGAEIEGVKFWGSPVSPRYYDWAFNRTRGAEIRAHWDLIPHDVNVLITHCPPVDIGDLNYAGRHEGCIDLRAALARLQYLRLHVFGHIHTGYGVYTIDQQENVVAVMAVVGVDPKLMDDLEVVFAPVTDVDERVGKRRAIVAGEVVFFAEANGILENVGRNEIVQEACELGIGEFDAIEGLKLLAKVGFQRSAVTDVLAVGILQITQLGDE